MVQCGSIATVLLFAASCGGDLPAALPALERSPLVLPSPPPQPSPVPSPIPSPSPSPIPSPTPYLVVIIVTGGDYGFVSARTVPGATCNARATLPNRQDAPGLRNPQVADSRGMVSWWFNQAPTDQGHGMYLVSCSLNGQVAEAFSIFEVGS
jgi:hypothetical protein